MMRPPPSGHMVINMKTTITTHGAHNGMIVQAGVQSGAASSHNTQWYVPSRFPQIQTPAIIGPQAIVPHASHENLATSWPSLQIAANSPVPEQSRLKQRNAFLPENSPNLHAQQQQQHQEQQQRHRPPLPTGTQSTSPSPIFPFNRQDSSPEEFIEPTKITLNVFNPGRSDPLCFETNLQRSTMENADALINDTVTTTTTVEVFRTALDAEKPERLVTLPPPPVPSIVDRPQLVRLNGPDHETWTSRRTETLINDRPIQTAHQGKAVQWKGTLVDEKKGAQKITAYNPYSGLRSPYENAITSRQPLVIRRQIQPGNVDPSDEGLLSRHNSYESAYLVYSPSEFPVVSHPVITRSQENLSRSPYQADLKMAKESALLTDSHDLACHPAIPDTSVNYVNRLETPILNKATSSGYEQVRRTVSAYNPGRYLDSGSLKHCSSEAHGILPDQTTAHPIRHHSRRPRSSSRGRRHRDNPLQRNCDNEQQKHCVGNANRSESPFHQKSVECATTNCYTTAPSDSLFLAYSKRPDPNLLPGEVPLRAKSQEIFNLYQTRDIMQNVVAQL